MLFIIMNFLPVIETILYIFTALKVAVTSYWWWIFTETQSSEVNTQHFHRH